MRYLAILFLFLATSVAAKPITFVVSDLFGSAKFVGEVVVTGYDGNGLIFFKSTQFKDTIHSASCNKPAKNGDTLYSGVNEYWTGKLPFIGDTVLVVVNGYNETSVFGKRIGKNYRLWSLLNGMSASFFIFQHPVLPLDTQRISGHGGDSTSCWDGCLIPIDQLGSLIRTYKTRFAKRLNEVNISKLTGKEALYVFYEEPLRLFSDMMWTDEPPGKLKSLILTYSNGKSLEIIPVIDKNSPTQFDINRQFDMEKFRAMKIKEIRWIE